MREEIHRAVETAVGAQDVRTSFESDDDEPGGLMRVMESKDYRAEIRYLRYPDTNEPMNNPWHVKILGPDPLHGGRGPVWSGSYSDEDEAVGTASGKLQRFQREHERRQGMDTTDAQVHAAVSGVESIADELRQVRGVSVDRVQSREEHFDNRDFIDLTFTRSSSAGQAFQILHDNHFRPSAMAGRWDEGRVVIQWHRP